MSLEERVKKLEEQMKLIFPNNPKIVEDEGEEGEERFPSRERKHRK